jgi:protein-disulfide isomerase
MILIKLVNVFADLSASYAFIYKIYLPRVNVFADLSAPVIANSFARLKKERKRSEKGAKKHAHFMFHVEQCLSNLLYLT